VVRELVAGTTPDDLRAVTAAPLRVAADLSVLVPT
jgi:acyl CoA:acetate/3-ketoacid CoA transferase beta subunit